jgi:hypothetical protein
MRVCGPHASTRCIECPCYLAGWEWGYRAGEAAAKDEQPDEDDGPRLN